MRRTVLAALAGALVLSSALPADAAVKGISMKEYSFSPKIVKVAMGTTVKWTDNGSLHHTSTQNSPLAKWDTGDVAPGASATTTVRWAGTYPYHCKYHQSLGMVGSVKVPDRVSPASGTTGTTFTITVATQAAPSGFVYDIQKRKGSSSWTAYKTGITSRTATFHPGSSGTYSFRSRLRETSNGAHSGWSPPRSISVM